MGGMMVIQQQVECDACVGLGKTCGVDAMTSKQEVLHLNVYPGCPENSIFVFAGMSNDSLKAPTGDIIFKIVYKNSKTYKVIEDSIDLELRNPIKISLHDSLVGFSRTLTHPRGHNIKIISQSPIKPGRYCLVGHGIHLQHTSYDKTGDMYFTIDVNYPGHINESGEKLGDILGQARVPNGTISSSEFPELPNAKMAEAAISTPRPYNNITSFLKRQNENATAHMRKSGSGEGGGGCAQS
jgi:DnaJ-class molecular chaperone